MSTTKDIPDAPEWVRSTNKDLVDALCARIDVLREIKLEQRERIAVLTAERDAARAQVAELEANAIRMREYRFALEGIKTDGKGNPLLTEQDLALPIPVHDTDR